MTEHHVTACAYARVYIKDPPFGMILVIVINYDTTLRGAFMRGTHLEQLAKEGRMLPYCGGNISSMFYSVALCPLWTYALLASLILS